MKIELTTEGLDALLLDVDCVKDFLVSIEWLMTDGHDPVGYDEGEMVRSFKRALKKAQELCDYVHVWKEG